VEEVGAGAAAVGADVKPPNPPKPEEAGAVAFGGAVRPRLRKTLNYFKRNENIKLLYNNN
jgi:hypothetical protein